MDFWSAVESCLSKYATFRGRARRAEYWYFILFTVAASIVAGILDRVLELKPGFLQANLSTLVTALTALPWIAVLSRRLHDTGHSFWWWLASFLCGVVGGFIAGLSSTSGLKPTGLLAFVMLANLGLAAQLSLVVLVWLIWRSDRGPNDYGPDPLGRQALRHPYAPPGGGAWG